MYFLCKNFNVLTTGGTFEEITSQYVNRTFGNLTNDNKSQICSDWKLTKNQKLSLKSERDLDEWRKVIMAGLKNGDRPAEQGVKGMIDVISRLVDGKIDAVIHLTDWHDRSAKQDTAVLSREANVHDIPVATNVETAEAFIKQWLIELSNVNTPPEVVKKNLFHKPDPPCNKLRVTLEQVYEACSKNKDTKVLALISHNGKKTEMDIFVAEHKEKILKSNYILATESTGERILRILNALDTTDYSNKICCCKSGPKGGDLQIAQAVIKGICTNIIFFQDPAESQPHDADIKLFEQAVTTPEVHARLATNPASAKLLIDSLAN
jgi:methylglyoxal synthase